MNSSSSAPFIAYVLSPLLDSTAFSIASSADRGFSSFTSATGLSFTGVSLGVSLTVSLTVSFGASFGASLGLGTTTRHNITARKPFTWTMRGAAGLGAASLGISRQHKTHNGTDSSPLA